MKTSESCCCCDGPSGDELFVKVSRGQVGPLCRPCYEQLHGCWVDTVQACLEAAGAPRDLDRQEAVVKAAGRRPSDYIRAQLAAAAAGEDGESDSPETAGDRYTAETRLVERHLQEAGFSDVVAYRFNPASIRIRVIDQQFSGLTYTQRQQRLEPHLARLPEATQRDVLFLVLLTPAEQADSSRQGLALAGRAQEFERWR